MTCILCHNQRCIKPVFPCFRDLLSTDPNQKLDVKMAPEGGVHVPGLTSYEVSCVDDVNQVWSLL